MKPQIFDEETENVFDEFHGVRDLTDEGLEATLRDVERELEAQIAENPRLLALLNVRNGLRFYLREVYGKEV